MKKFHVSRLLLLFLINFFLVFFANSSFVFTAESKEYEIFESSNVQPVCYISGDNPRYFTTIEREFIVLQRSSA